MTARTTSPCPTCHDRIWVRTEQGLWDACPRCTRVAKIDWQARDQLARWADAA